MSFHFTPADADFERAADHRERLGTALEWKANREKAEEGLLRSVVRERLTPVAHVEIPGLGLNVPVYDEEELASVNPALVHSA